MINATNPAPQCYLCEATDTTLKGDGGFRKRCRNEIDCQRRIAEKRLPNLAVVPPAKGTRASESPAEAVIALMQQTEYANVGPLSGPWVLGDKLSLPIAAAQARSVVFGKSGSGKSNVSAVTGENCIENDVPVQILDGLGNLHGLRAKGKASSGLPIVILGGEYGDLPLYPTDAELIADIFAQGHSALLDLSQLSLEEQQDFSTDYFRRLLRVLRRPSHIIVEEAETFVPGFSKSSSAFASQAAATVFARQIRNFGVGWTFSTQRMTNMHPDVYGSASVFIAMLSTSDEVQKLLGKEARSRIGRDAGNAILDELGRLRRGEAWLVPDPDWLGNSVSAPRRFMFRERKTFDSTTVPRIGETTMKRPPSVPADLRPFQPLVERHNDGTKVQHKAKKRRKS
jgi:hypothetical protein